MTKQIFLPMEEEFTDVVGNKMVLPSDMKICSCHYCRRTATRSPLANILARLKAYRDKNWLVELAGFQNGIHPVCKACAETYQVTFNLSFVE